MLTAKRLRELLHYNPNTGEWHWRVSRNGRVKPGDKAGYRLQVGYWLIRVDGVRYYANRLAVLYMTGRWPMHWVDHINRDSTDDRWSNLREATPSQNRMNSRDQRGDGELRGAHFQDGKWKALIRKDKKLIYLGRFETKELAHAAYLSAAHQLYGEFAP